ncbi:MAG: 5'-methylthioadenosine/S-adenosylhomocysteine nucleosidase [SAR324 cluster bacterium]|nr:5'-methylthioadenosine/S-adenosylhomocysteine nucleosidase [SAR324 cluster bacterium]
MPIRPSRTLLFIAGENELEAFFGDCPKGKELIYDDWDYYEAPSLSIVHTGMGSINAACAAHSFIKKFRPNNCLQVGLSGAHVDSLKIGDILLGKDVKEFSRHTKAPSGKIIPRSHFIQRGKDITPMSHFPGDVHLLQACSSLLERNGLSFQEAIVGSADQFNRNPQFIDQIHSIFQTWCEDMESSAIAQVAKRLDTPFLTIRVISNNELTTHGKSEEGKQLSDIAFQKLTLLGQVFLQHFPHDI